MFHSCVVWLFFFSNRGTFALSSRPSHPVVGYFPVRVGFVNRVAQIQDRPHGQRFPYSNKPIRISPMCRNGHAGVLPGPFNPFFSGSGISYYETPANYSHVVQPVTQRITGPGWSGHSTLLLPQLSGRCRHDSSGNECPGVAN